MGILDRFKNIIKFDKLTIGGKETSSTNTTPSTTSTDITTFKVTELKALAKERGLKGYSTLKKAELLTLLSE